MTNGRVLKPLITQLFSFQASQYETTRLFLMYRQRLLVEIIQNTFLATALLLPRITAGVLNIKITKSLKSLTIKEVHSSTIQSALKPIEAMIRQAFQDRIHKFLKMLSTTSYFLRSQGLVSPDFKLNPFFQRINSIYNLEEIRQHFSTILVFNNKT